MSIRSTQPNTYADIDASKLIQIYESGPRRVMEIMEGLSETELKTRPTPKKWSIFEIVVHLADSEIVGAMRIRQTFTGSSPQFAVYDQDVWAEVLGYRELDMAAFYHYVKLFELLRQTTVAIFRKAQPADWQKSGLHPERGSITLRQLLELYADHSERHIAQVVKCREALGKPKKFSLLLEKRLF